MGPRRPRSFRGNVAAPGGRIATLFTVGHSNHPIEHFVRLLRAHAITALADVRATPFSRRNPQYNRDALAASLEKHLIGYLYFGKELGARPMPYGEIARTASFKDGIERLLASAAADGQRLAYMCAEREPLDCHRTLLVSPAIATTGAEIFHILADASLEPHNDTMTRLLHEMRMPAQDLFLTRAQLLDEAIKKKSGPKPALSNRQ